MPEPAMTICRVFLALVVFWGLVAWWVGRG
jgi:hypothetical protein